jgi:pyruvate kinase
MCFRLNFSHGTHDEHSAVLADIRTMSRELGQHAILLRGQVAGQPLSRAVLAGEVS